MTNTGINTWEMHEKNPIECLLFEKQAVAIYPRVKTVKIPSARYDVIEYRPLKHELI